jgi:hypothetical protein
MKRVRTEVTDRSYELLVEIEGLRRELTAAHGKLNRQQDLGTHCAVQLTRGTVLTRNAVREELKGEYEGLVKDLTLQIQTLHSNFAEYKTHLYQDILGSLYDVRKEAMQKMVETSAAPVELKRKTVRIAKVEEDLNEMKVHNREMSQAVRACLFVPFRLAAVLTAM